MGFSSTRWWSASGSTATRASRSWCARCARWRSTPTNTRNCRSKSWWRSWPPSRDLGHNPLFQAMFAAPRTRAPPCSASAGTTGGGTDWVDIDRGSASSTSSFISKKWATAFRFVEYATDLFERETIARWIGSLGKLLDLPLVADAAVEAAGDRRAEVRARRCASRSVDQCRAFLQQVAARPDAVAIEWDAQQLSYGELDRRANQLARRLRQGVRTETQHGRGAAALDPTR